MTTTFQAGTAHETKVIVSTETKIDVEREIAEQVRRIQRYKAKWSNRGKGGGRPETIAANIEDALNVIGELRMGVAIRGELAEKTKAFMEFYQTKIAPEINQP